MQFIIKNVCYLITALMGMLFGSCSTRNSPEPSITDQVEPNNTDYSTYDFEEIVALSLRTITDTLWDSKKDSIIGFQVEKSANHGFMYPITAVHEKPLMNSFVSLKDLPELEVANYVEQSKSKVEYLNFLMYDWNLFEVSSISSWDDLSKQVENLKGSMQNRNILAHKDYTYKFQSYENLKLLFEENVDIRALFAISESDYHKLKKIGWLHYSERETITIRSRLNDQYNFNPYFSLEQINQLKIARVSELNYGKIAYMVLDAAESTNALVNKLSYNQMAHLDEAEIAELNTADVHFFFRGYTEEEINNVQSFKTTAEKIDAYLTLAVRNFSPATFDYERMGVPISFKLSQHSQTTDKLSKLNYTTKVDFK
ncbi:hypothetical protein [Sphingobacterium hungaricum]